MRICKAPECNEPFEPNVHNQVYCSSECKREVDRRRKRQALVEDIAQVVVEYDDEDDEQVEFLRRENRRLENLVRKHKFSRSEEIRAIYDIMGQVASGIDLTPVTPPRNLPRAREAEVANPILADLQTGKETRSYNSEICRQRIELFADKTLRLTDIQRSDHPVNVAHVYALGDIVEGEDIFPGNGYEIDASLYRQIVTGVEIVSDFLKRMLSHFERVHFAGVIGNHGRLFKRGGDTYNPESNMDRLLYKFVSMLFENEPRITFDIPDGPGARNFYLVDRIGDYSTLLVHGDQFPVPTSGHGYFKKVLGWKESGIREDFDAVVCFTPGALVLTRDGFRPIEDVLVGTEVLTHEGHWKPVVATSSRESDTISLKGQGHPGLITTPEHPFYATEPIFNNDNTWSHFKEFEWVEAKDMKRKFWLSPCIFPELPIPPIRSHGSREKEWEVTVPLMRLIGRWLGDGFFREHGLSISSHIDEHDTVVQEFENASIHHHSSPSKASKCEAHHIYGNALKRWTKEHFGEYAAGKRVPAWVLGAPEEMRRAFLEGYISADGHVTAYHKGRHFEACSINKNIAIGIKLLAQSLGYATYLYLDERGGRVHELPGGHMCTVQDRWIVKGMSSFERYRESIVIDDMFAARVRKIEDKGKDVVYNLTVADDSSYIVDGIVVHNCGHYHQNTKMTIGSTVLRVVGSPESDNTYASERLGVMGRPSQHLQFVHPKRGVTAEYDVWLDD